MFKPRLNGTSRNLLEEGVCVHSRGTFELDGLEGPFQPKPPQIFMCYKINASSQGKKDNS